MLDKWVADVTVNSGNVWLKLHSIPQVKHTHKKKCFLYVFFIKQGKSHASGAKLKIQYRIREYSSILSTLFIIARHLWMYKNSYSNTVTVTQLITALWSLVWWFISINVTAIMTECKRALKTELCWGHAACGLDRSFGTAANLYFSNVTYLSEISISSAHWTTQIQVSCDQDKLSLRRWPLAFVVLIYDITSRQALSEEQMVIHLTFQLTNGCGCHRDFHCQLHFVRKCIMFG